MGNITRKPRKKLSKIMDTLKPITIDMLGTEEDPCFGKHLNPKAPECQRCGDSEICAIAMQQRLQIKRAEVEKNGNFKDLEEEKKADQKVIRKMMRVRVKELAKLNKKGEKIDGITDDIHSTYVLHGWTKKKIRRFIERLCEKSEYLSITGDTIKYHKK